MNTLDFDWNFGNIRKSEMKHGIIANEAESVFSDIDKLTFDDLKHSEEEFRYICIGKSKLDRILYCYFTYRETKIRVIGIRPANKREKNIYEQTRER